MRVHGCDYIFNIAREDNIGAVQVRLHSARTAPIKYYRTRESNRGGSIIYPHPCLRHPRGLACKAQHLWAWTTSYTLCTCISIACWVPCMHGWVQAYELSHNWCACVLAETNIPLLLQVNSIMWLNTMLCYWKCYRFEFYGMHSI